ncbi:MAG TPA: DUF5947 family protein [Kofleriaceae bacterium]|jgi:hypothetical protein
MKRLFAATRAAATNAAHEACELCGAPIAALHAHVLARADRAVRCACDACSILMQGSERFRTIPRDRTRLAVPQIDAWLARLRVPVGIAAITRFDDGRTQLAFPGPAGLAVAELEAETWDALCLDVPALRSLAPETEAVIFANFASTASGPLCGAWRVGVDVVYQLVGAVRTAWVGLSGGPEAMTALATVLREIDATAADGGHDPRVEALVRTTLYEGYALYPYRPSALKNQRRFAFGAVYPRQWAERAHEPFTQRAEFVFAGESLIARATVRFLVLHAGGGGDEHSIDLPALTLVEGERNDRIERAGLTIEWNALVTGSGQGLWRIAIEVSNLTPCDPSGDLEAAMDVTLASTHVLIRVPGARAISTIDPPAEAADAVAACRTLGCFPVLVARDTMLASPIVLPDFPELAPASPGEFFDATEMDEMLTLRVLTMTDAEKAEAAANDPRIAALLARTEARGVAETAHLHGRNSVEWRAGMRVALRPKKQADSFDIVLAGKRATISRVERDLDGRVHCAVVIDDDPGADLGELGMPGHRFYFAPDELEVLA